MTEIYELPIREIMRRRKGNVKLGRKAKLTPKQREKNHKLYLKSYYEKNKEEIKQKQRERYKLSTTLK
jgi:hypothetical protein